MSPEECKQMALDFVDEVFNKGNVNEVERFLSPDFKYHARGEDVEGIEKFKEWVLSDHDVFGDIRYTIADNFAGSGKVAIAWLVEAVHEKEYRGIPATHKKFETLGISIFHFADTKIKEAWTVADSLTPALEIGAVRAVTSESDAA